MPVLLKVTLMGIVGAGTLELPYRRWQALPLLMLRPEPAAPLPWSSAKVWPAARLMTLDGMDWHRAAKDGGGIGHVDQAPRPTTAPPFRFSVQP